MSTKIKVAGDRKEPYRLWFQCLARGLASEDFTDAQQRRARAIYKGWGDVISYWQPPPGIRGHKGCRTNRFDEWFEKYGQWLFAEAEAQLADRSRPLDAQIASERFNVVLVPKSYTMKSTLQEISELLPPSQPPKWSYGARGRWMEMRYHLRVWDKLRLEGKTYREAFMEIVEEDAVEKARNPKSFDKARNTARKRFTYKFDGVEKSDMINGRPTPERIKTAISYCKREAHRQITSALNGIFPAKRS